MAPSSQRTNYHFWTVRGRFLPVWSVLSEIHVPQTGMSLDELNKNLIIQALEMSNGNKAKAAKLLGMSRPTMIYRIEKYGIRVPEKD